MPASKEFWIICEKTTLRPIGLDESPVVLWENVLDAQELVAIMGKDYFVRRAILSTNME